MIAQVREPVLEYPFVLEYLNYNTSSSYTRKKQRVDPLLFLYPKEAGRGCFYVRISLTIIEALLIPEVPYTRVIYALFNHMYSPTTNSNSSCVLNRFPSLLRNHHAGVAPLLLFLSSTYR